MTKKPVLVTGGAGFIGSALIKRMTELGRYDVTTIDNLSTGVIENVPQEARLIVGDCEDPEIISELKNESFETIFHIAGQSSGEVSFENPVADLRGNCESTLRLLSLAREINCRRFVYASTMSVYGDTPLGKEDMATWPLSFYGVGKVASENYMRIFRSYGIRSAALRLFNVYGPGQNLKNLKQGMVSIYLAMAFKERHVQIKGSTSRFRDFVFIDDVVESFFEAERYVSNNSGTFNIGTGRKTTVEELMSLIKEGVDFHFTVEELGGTPGDQTGIVAHVEKVRRDLNWAPSVQIREGLQTTIKWISNMDEFRGLR